MTLVEAMGRALLLIGGIGALIVILLAIDKRFGTGVMMAAFGFVCFILATWGFYP